MAVAIFQIKPRLLACSTFNRAAAHKGYRDAPATLQRNEGQNRRTGATLTIFIAPMRE